MQPDEIIDLKLTALQIEQIMQNLLEMPYRVAAPILSDINAQIESHRTKLKVVGRAGDLHGD